jgi:hypothetical protein
MKREFTIITLLFFMTQVAYCQLHIDWQHCYGGSESEYAYDIIPTGNGYLLAGDTWSNDGDISFSHGENDIWLINIDKTGNLMWERTYGGSETDGAYRIVRSRGSTNYFLVGGSTSNDGDILNNSYPGSRSFWIVKIDSLGNKIWNRIVGGNIKDQILNGSATSDGGVVALGYTASSDGDVSTYYGLYDIWMIKLNSNGDTDWDFTIGTSQPEIPGTIIQTADEGFLVGGSGTPQGGGNIDCITPSPTIPDAILFKLDSNGNEEWQHCYGGSGHDGINGLLELEDGYMISSGGGSDDGDLEGSGYHGGDGDIWLVKIDFSGNIIWQKCYGGSNTESASNVFQTSDGGFIVFGSTYSFDGDITENHSLDEFRPSIWVFKVNSTGELLWQQCIGGLGKESIEFGVVKNSDYNYVVAGRTTNSPSFDVECSNHVNNGRSDFWVFQLTDTTVRVNELTRELPLKVYPNPATNSATFSYSLPVGTHQSRIEVRNTTGQLVASTRLNEAKGEWVLHFNNIPAGLYIYTLSTQQSTATGKLVVSGE